MPDRLVERGIGETRSVRIAGGEIVEARILVDGVVPASSIVEARLAQAGKPAIATASGAEYLLPGGAPGITEGAACLIEVTREQIAGSEPWKRPLARLALRGAAPAVAGLPGEALAFPSPVDQLEAAGWSDLLDEARSGIVRFPGGELRVSPTPAMTLIDVDGHLPAAELALKAATAAARTILRHGIGGSIGIDFPTVAGKGPRQAIAEAFDAALPQPFERTTVNGFGFLQVVRPRRHPSLFELAQERASFEARALLRQAAMGGPGSKRLVAHPAVAALLERNPAWLEQLARQIGGTVSLRAEPSLAISGAYAEQA
ncbi:ribonuclease [Sphingomonas sinipercae]|uniref:Ribonuclease n=1 Tax=Sphingomonas sinipercae TaxID=2714944 RepID=A0A6G7ZLB3_9SPHN|nr:ribonuclease [Sphingomonas sinipercae]QIL01709.1 ribonuclease [Sphingomonas sinipercae]